MTSLYDLTLKEINASLLIAQQWKEHDVYTWSTNVSFYLAKAQSLIELLEVFNCGSTGGSDKGQTARLSLKERFEWLKTHARTEGNNK